MISLRPGMEKDRDDVIRQLIDIQYDTKRYGFSPWHLPGAWRCAGDLSGRIHQDTAIRVEFFGDEIDRITEIDVLTGEIKSILQHAAIFPASHYVVPQEQIKRAADAIRGRTERTGSLFQK